MPPTLRLGLALSAFCLFGLGTSSLRADEPELETEPNAPVSFSKQVLPILQRKCQGCHQPAKAQGKLDLTSHAALFDGGETGPGVVPGEPEESELLAVVLGDEPLMPPVGEQLNAVEIDILAQWIAQGAEDDTPAQAKDTIDADHPPLYAAPPVITALAFAPDGKHLVVGGYREILVHKADGSELVARLVGQAQRIESVVFSPDGRYIAAVGGSPGRFGEIQFWNAETFVLLAAVRSTYDTVYGGAWSPDGQRFSFGCADNSARMIDPREQEELLKIDHHTDWVFSTTFSLDGKHLITLGRDGALKLTESDSGSFIDDIGKNYGELKVMARHPKENQVVIGGEERIPRLYQIYRTRARDPQYTDFNLLRAFETQPGPIASIAFSPDGGAIAVGGSFPEVRLYNVEDAERTHTLKGFEGGVFALGFSPDGGTIAAGGFDGKVRLFDTQTGELQAEFFPVPLEEPDSLALAPGQED